MPKIYGANADLLGKVMDLRMERQNLVMANIANMNIPGYKTRSMDFEGALQAAVGTAELRNTVSRTNAKHVPTAYEVNNFSGQVAKEFKPRTIYGADAVDLDKEMALMSKNSLAYNSLTMLTQKNFEGITKVIMDGGK